MAKSERRPFSFSLPVFRAALTLPGQYIADLIANAEAARQEKIARLRPHYQKLFKQNRDRIKYYSTFRTAEKVFEDDRVWKSLERAEDRRTLFDEYVHDLKTAKQVRTRVDGPPLGILLIHSARTPKQPCASETSW